MTPRKGIKADKSTPSAAVPPPGPGSGEPTYLTPGQVAALLHVSPKTVNRWANMGLIPCIVTLGGHRRFHRDAVKAVVDEMLGTT